MFEVLKQDEKNFTNLNNVVLETDINHYFFYRFIIILQKVLTMDHKITKDSRKVLIMSTLTFTMCFAVWMLNGVLVTFLVDKGVFSWTPTQIGVLMGIPVLFGALSRLPLGILTDRYGGKPVFIILLIFCSLPLFALSFMNSYLGFVICSLGFGIIGGGFTVATTYTSVWYPKEWQGRALGIVGAGNAGAGITTLFAPTILENLTNNGSDIEKWRILPVAYGVILLIFAILFFVLMKNKKVEQNQKSIKKLLKPLKQIRVWRFGLYYFLVFGCFVAFAQWLVPYFVNMYYTSLVTAGILAAAFSIPSGVIRILGGWFSDKWGARRVMYWVLGSSLFISLFLIFPKMEVITPGAGIMSTEKGEVTFVSDTLIKVNDKSYYLESQNQTFDFEHASNKNIIFPTKDLWHEPVVKVGDHVEKKQLISKGTTRIYFQANLWVAAILIVIIGSIWGIGKAAVYKHIPDYFPGQVGVVGGMVGVLGGLGGFICPIIFGYLLEATGFWTSCWIFMAFLSGLCLFWMQKVIQKMMKEKEPELMKRFDNN